MNSIDVATRPLTAKQIISDHNMTPDQHEFLKLHIFPDSLTDKLHEYGKLLVESSKVSKSIRKKDKIITTNHISIPELPEEIQVIIAGEKASRQEDLKSLYARSENLLEQFQKISTGIELIQLLDKFQKFLSDEDQSNLEKLCKKIDFINDEHILTKRDRKSWPPELSKKEMRPLLDAYKRIMSEATFIAGKPIPIELNIPPVKDPSEDQENSRAPHGDNSLIEHLTEQGFKVLVDDKRLKQMSPKMIRHRLHKIRTVADFSESELCCTLNEKPDIILDDQVYQQFIQRTKILKEISLNYSYSGSKPEYDSLLAKSLLELFKDELYTLSDKDAFSVLKTIRTLVANAVKESGIFNLQSTFKEFVLKESGLTTQFQKHHPLKSVDFEKNTKAILQFFKSRDFSEWRKDPLTIESAKKLIMDKIRGTHVGAPREDWIKANFSSISSTKAMDDFKEYLDQLIEGGHILTSGGSHSKASLRAA
jgi:hypothetical protein